MNKANPDHYNRTKIQPWDIACDWVLNFCDGNALKYIVRAGYKENEDLRDELRKACAYFRREIKRLNEYDTPTIYQDISMLLDHWGIDDPNRRQAIASIYFPSRATHSLIP